MKFMGTYSPLRANHFQGDLAGFSFRLELKNINGLHTLLSIGALKVYIKVKHRRNKYCTNIPKPYKEDWLAIGDTLIWLPKDRVQTNDKLSSPAKLDVVFNGAGWAIARSALNIMLPLYYQDRIKYQIEWVTKIGEGLSREVYRADVTIINDGEEEHDLLAVSLILNDADIDVYSRLIKEQYVQESIYNKTECFSVPKPMEIFWKDGSLFSFTSFIRGFPLEIKTAKSLNKKPWENSGQNCC